MKITEERITLLRQLGELANRRTGRTTRLVDEYIQKLYDNQGEWIEIHDHYPCNKRLNDRLVLDRIMQRMTIEHKYDKVEVDKPKNKIKLVSSSRDTVYEEMDRIRKELAEIERN